MKAEIFAAMHDYAASARDAEQAVRTMQKERMNGPVYSRMWLVGILLQNRDVPRAEAVLSELKHDIEGLDSSSMQAYWGALGCIEQAKGDLPAAIAHLEKGVRGNSFIPRHLSLARAYLEAKRFGDAARELEGMTSDYFDEGRILSFGPIFHFHLASAYERMGEAAKAAAEYERFLDILKNADSVIPEVNDARQHLAQLKKKV
jgi:tetratricopeptide (TPR) repeat protein